MKWLRSFKGMFGERDLELTVTSAVDETEYLMSSPANAKIIEERLAYLANGGETIMMTNEQLDEMSRDSNAKH